MKCYQLLWEVFSKGGEKSSRDCSRLEYGVCRFLRRVFRKKTLVEKCLLSILSSNHGSVHSQKRQETCLLENIYYICKCLYIYTHPYHYQLLEEECVIVLNLVGVNESD